MKRCPQCAAEFEDHVEFCFVDGSALPTDSVEAAAAPMPSAPPVVRPPPRRASRSIVPYLLLLFLISVVMLFGGAATAWLMLRAPGTTATPTPLPAPPTPTLPPPVPVPAPSRSVEIGFTSSPTEAQVWENETELCLTPCYVDHPDYAALPRTFVLKKAGHPDTSVQLTDPTVPQHIDLLVQKRPTAPRQPTPAVRPKPAIATER